MYKYYYRVDEDTQDVIYHFNEKIVKPIERDIFDAEYTERHLHKKIRDGLTEKWLYKNANNKMVLKTMQELEDTPEEILNKKMDIYKTRIISELADKLIDIEDKSGSVEDIILMVKTIKAEVGL